MRVVPLSDTRTLAKLAMGAVAVSSIVDVLASILFAQLISDAQSTSIWDLMDLPRQAEVVDNFGWAQIVVRLLAAGVFIAWFYPAYRNLSRLGKKLNHDAGWAIGAWFVPILNWFRPYAIYSEMADTYSLVAKKFPQHLLPNTPTQSQLGLLGGWWWGLYVAGRVLGGIADRVVRRSEEMPHVWVTWPNYLVAISGILAIILIYRLNKVETAAYRAWISGDYQAYLDAKDDAKVEKLITPEDGKSAEWYKSEAENEKSLNRDEDPFS